jgi:hypothetical protein
MLARAERAGEYSASAATARSRISSADSRSSAV